MRVFENLTTIKVTQFLIITKCCYDGETKND